MATRMLLNLHDQLHDTSPVWTGIRCPSITVTSGHGVVVRKPDDLEMTAFGTESNCDDETLRGGALLDIGAHRDESPAR